MSHYRLNSVQDAMGSMNRCRVCGESDADVFWALDDLCQSCADGDFRHDQEQERDD